MNDYLMGERTPVTDMMAWNANATRMPYRMHSEYLRRLFADNDLAAGRYRVDGRAVALTDIRAPIFAVGTEWDHVAPWRSVYKLHLLVDTDVTFALANGGHNMGIISDPGSNNRSYRAKTKRHDEPYTDSETWLTEATLVARLGTLASASFQWDNNAASHGSACPPSNPRGRTRSLRQPALGLGGDQSFSTPFLIEINSLRGPVP